MTHLRLPLLVLGLPLLLLTPGCDSTAPAAAPSDAAVTPEAADAAATPAAAFDDTAVPAAACESLGWSCTDGGTVQTLAWAQGSAGFVTVETAELDTAVLAWREHKGALSFRVVAQTHDGSGAGIHNVVALADAMVADPAAGTIAAKVTLRTTEPDGETCITTSDAQTHLVVCTQLEAFDCGALPVDVDSTTEADAQCCKASSSDCAAGTQRGLRAAVSFAEGNWTVAAAETLGSKPEGAQLAAEGNYSAQALLNTFTLPPDGLEL